MSINGNQNTVKKNGKIVSKIDKSIKKVIVLPRPT